MRGTCQRSREHVQFLRVSWYPERPLRFPGLLLRVLRTNPRRPVHRVSTASFANHNDRFSELQQFRLTTSAIACDVVVVRQWRVTARDPEEAGDPLSVGVTSVTMQQ